MFFRFNTQKYFSICRKTLNIPQRSTKKPDTTFTPFPTAIRRPGLTTWDILRVARASTDAGRWVNAWVWYNEALSDVSDPEAQGHVSDLLDSVEHQVLSGICFCRYTDKIDKARYRQTNRDIHSHINICGLIFQFLQPSYIYTLLLKYVC